MPKQIDAVDSASMVRFVEGRVQRLEAKMSYIISRMIEALGDRKVVDAKEVLQSINEDLSKSFELEGETTQTLYNFD